MTRRPKIDQAFDTELGAFDAACEADPLIVEAIRHANGATSDDARTQHLGFAAERLAAATTLPASDWLVLLSGKTRISTIPGVPGRVVWAIRDAADAAALRDAVGAEQVWIRADLVRSDDWPTVRAAAADAVERTIGIVRKPGRPEGSTDKALDALIAAVREMPAMTPAEIDSRGVELGHWDSAVDDFEQQARAKRIRAAARRIKP